MRYAVRSAGAISFALQITASFALASVGYAQPAPPAANAMASAMNGMTPVRHPLARKLPPGTLAAMLQQGGYVILMRHASSPTPPPDPASADPDNARHERQLDATGLADARAFGAGLRRLHIPLGAVFTSPTFRARETLREARIAPFQPMDFLNIRAAPGQPPAQADIVTTRQLLATPPRAGTDTLVVTHYPNVTGQFPAEGSTLQEGDMLILAPASYGARVVGAMAIGDWATLGLRCRSQLGRHRPACRSCP